MGRDPETPSSRESCSRARQGLGSQSRGHPLAFWGPEQTSAPRPTPEVCPSSATPAGPIGHARVQARRFPPMGGYAGDQGLHVHYWFVVPGRQAQALACEIGTDTVGPLFRVQWVDEEAGKDKGQTPALNSVSRGGSTCSCCDPGRCGEAVRVSIWRSSESWKARARLRGAGRQSQD